MKKFLCGYRILMGLFLLMILIQLAAKGLAAFAEPLLLWFVALYPPYSGYLLLGGILLGGAWAMLFAVMKAFHRTRKPSEPLAKMSRDPESLTEALADAEVSAEFRQLAERCGATLVEGDAAFFLAFQNPDHAIWCANDQGEFIVGLAGSPHHEHCYNIEDARKEIENILAEKAVHMIFFNAKGAEHWNDCYSIKDLDAKISARFHPIRTHQPWWIRCLRIIFLFFPPFTPKVLWAEIYSYRGSYDRKVFRKK